MPIAPRQCGNVLNESHRPLLRSSVAVCRRGSTSGVALR